MPFVKLDCGILHSTLWLDRDQRDIFITALLMAKPTELPAPVPQIALDSMNPTGWTVPEGLYGFVEAAGTAIIRQAGLEANRASRAALERLGAPEPDSRSTEYDGRRLVRVNGGFIVLNYWRYRERDNTNAVRQQRFREKQETGENAVTSVARNTAPASVSVVALELESETEPKTKTALIVPEKNRRVRQVTVTRTERENGLRFAANVIFGYYRDRFGKTRCILDRKREVRIIERLRENDADVSEILYAIDGALRDDWIMGRSPNSVKKYDGIETILRDRAQVERFVALVPERLERHPFLEAA